MMQTRCRRTPCITAKRGDYPLIIVHKVNEHHKLLESVNEHRMHPWCIQRERTPDAFYAYSVDEHRMLGFLQAAWMTPSVRIKVWTEDRVQFSDHELVMRKGIITNRKRKIIRGINVWINKFSETHARNEV